MPDNKKPHTPFYGWRVVGACVLINVYTGGVIFFGFTAVFEPIASEFGWSYAQVSFVASLRGLEMGLLAPLVGLLVDRWGPRKLIFTGSIIGGTGLILLSRVNSLPMFYGAFILISVGMSTSSSTVMITAVANWFRKRVATATGIVVSGFALGGLMVPLIVLLINAFGWRMAVVYLGLGMWIICLPLSLIVRHKPEQFGYLPDGETDSTTANHKSVTPPPSTDAGTPARQALTSRAFWHVALSAFYQSFAVNAVVTHIMPYLSSIGIAKATSSLMASALPVTSIGGRLGFGWLGDRFYKIRISAIGFSLMTLGLLFFSLVSSAGIWMLVPFVILFGIGWGGVVPMRPALLREYFGRTSFGTILGFVFGVMMMGVMIGAPLAGWAFDRWGSYQGIWLVFSGLGVAAITTILTAPSLRKRAA
jgi:MFS family permease